MVRRAVMGTAGRPTKLTHAQVSTGFPRLVRVSAKALNGGMETRVRPATLADAQAINAIHNHYVRTCTCTWQTIEETDENRLKWLKSRDQAHPVIVAEIGHQVVGWGSISAYNTRTGWSATVEDSVFVHHAHQGKGLGKLILGDLLLRAEQLGHKSVIARISGEQVGSLRLHASLGFEPAGLLKAVGRKFEQDLDCVYLLKSLRKP
ncbi:MAG: N-acetyltransferase family protein [Verrucomicrobia bacterium]|nr:N-acetyltransferase family protein [Verrucomicrobiota bacterium]NBY36760.1 N-acetyltransferase family protein [Verrucomicrobiota bacterium]